MVVDLGTHVCTNSRFQIPISFESTAGIRKADHSVLIPAGSAVAAWLSHCPIMHTRFAKEHPLSLPFPHKLCPETSPCMHSEPMKRLCFEYRAQRRPKVQQQQPLPAPIHSSFDDFRDISEIDGDGIWLFQDGGTHNLQPSETWLAHARYRLARNVYSRCSLSP